MRVEGMLAWPVKLKWRLKQMDEPGVYLISTAARGTNLGEPADLFAVESLDCRSRWLLCLGGRPDPKC